MKKSPRILFVCFADSTHAQSWMGLLESSQFDVRVFATSVANSGLYAPQPWKFPTYAIARPSPHPTTEQVKWLLPGTRRFRLLETFAIEQFDLTTRWLRHIIRIWKPDIVHSLSVNPASKLTWRALKPISQLDRPRWIVSSWGSEFYLGTDEPEDRKDIESILQDCDGFIADCRRDIQRALQIGLSPHKVMSEEPIPANGGLNIDNTLVTQIGHSSRNLIVVPKAYEGYVNKTLPILEALHLVEDELAEYEIHLLLCSEEISRWLKRMPESFKQRCHCHTMIPHDGVIKMLARARVMIATSLSDGTPSSMLEAMAVGALPLMSPVESIQEWITDGKNGLLANALHPDQIARALRRALTDNQLFEDAAIINRNIVSDHANRNQIRPHVLNCYRSLLKPRFQTVEF